MDTLKYLVERKFDVSNLLETKSGPNDKAIARATFCTVAREFFKVVDIVNYLGIPHSNYYRYIKYFDNSPYNYLNEIKNELIEDFRFSKLNHESLMDLISNEWEFMGFSENGEALIKLKDEERFFDYLENLKNNLHEFDYENIRFKPVDGFDDIINNPEPEEVQEIKGLKFGGIRFDLTRSAVGDSFDIYEPTERVIIVTGGLLCVKLGDFAWEFAYDLVEFLREENII